MSPVSERVSDASPPKWGDREVRSLALGALALLKAGQSGVSLRLDQCDAPSLAMSMYAAEERDSQPAQRDELAGVSPIGGEGGDYILAGYVVGKYPTRNEPHSAR